MSKLEYIVEPLLIWYEQNLRTLPWRDEPEPYRVWVSEIMLQQTRVEAVKPYFKRFLEALPTIRHLAEAKEDELLKLWEGLGYYNRVRNMQKAAKIVVETYGGKMPADYELLLNLPGIGSYTAGAVASISYGIAVPAVDGNVLRVLSRVTGDESDVLHPATKRKYEGLLKEIIPKDRAGMFNQALMELGAIVCVPNGEPKCTGCPWETFCRAKAEELLDVIPRKAKKKPRKTEEKTILIIRPGNFVIIQKRPEKGLLAGLYEFPSMEGKREEKEVLAYLETLGYRPIHIKRLEDAKHIFSHIEWHMTGYAVKVEEMDFMCSNPGNRAEGHMSVLPEEINQTYAIPAAFETYCKYVDIKLGIQEEMKRKVK
ncbi:MAG: A/G-specific adenine glycosylase [Lachnospiraceae bacterium]|nr:A/G-specific adenine glycosylase [Lachnospiraceae bacterium]